MNLVLDRRKIFICDLEGLEFHVGIVLKITETMIVHSQNEIYDYGS